MIKCKKCDAHIKGAKFSSVVYCSVCGMKNDNKDVIIKVKEA